MVGTLESFKKLDGITTEISLTMESDGQVMRVGQYFGRVERRCGGALTGQFDLRRRRWRWRIDWTKITLRKRC
jgi:hypothetical protein